MTKPLSLRPFLAASSLPLLALSVALATALCFEHPGQAQPQPFLLARAEQKSTFVPPKKKAPKGTTGAASRGLERCSQDATTTVPYMVLLSDHQALTTQERPTLLAYVASTKAQKLVFTLSSETGDEDYQTTIPLSGQPGVVRLSLPQEIKALQVGQNYKWSVILSCEAAVKPDSPWLEGSLKRVDLGPQLTRQLQKMQAIAKLNLYSKRGIWYDAISTLAELRKQQPNNAQLQREWTSLLESVGLGAIATAPVLD